MTDKTAENLNDQSISQLQPSDGISPENAEQENYNLRRTKFLNDLQKGLIVSLYNKEGESEFIQHKSPQQPFMKPSEPSNSTPPNEVSPLNSRHKSLGVNATDSANKNQEQQSSSQIQQQTHTPATSTVPVPDSNTNTNSNSNTILTSTNNIHNHITSPDYDDSLSLGNFFRTTPKQTPQIGIQQLTINQGMDGTPITSPFNPPVLSPSFAGKLAEILANKCTNQHQKGSKEYDDTKTPQHEHNNSNSSSNNNTSNNNLFEYGFKSPNFPPSPPPNTPIDWSQPERRQYNQDGTLLLSPTFINHHPLLSPKPIARYKHKQLQQSSGSSYFGFEGVTAGTRSQCLAQIGDNNNNCNNNDNGDDNSNDDDDNDNDNGKKSEQQAQSTIINRMEENLQFGFGQYGKIQTEQKQIPAQSPERQTSIIQPIEHQRIDSEGFIIQEEDDIEDKGKDQEQGSNNNNQISNKSVIYLYL
ncbi:MAG: hypothetical protein EZS28_024634 [Streblomastix strix]|uniref:Uncharacterized protein n=1 Tax=Streblomastix strix TaxID=222440 RepID=A0A5J4VB78_9EUKA|nr:MAG: hypothetical protein EZS28_024634 [Streblomastix strix]